MKYLSIVIILILGPVSLIAFCQDTADQPAQKAGTEGSKSGPQVMQLYDVPAAREPSDESAEEAADYLRITQIREPAPGAQLIEDFLKKYPSSKRTPVLHYGAFMLYQQLDNYDQLVEHGEKYLQTSPSNVTVISTLALAYASHGESDKAVERGTKAITLLDNLSKPTSGTDEARWNALRNQLLAMNYASLGVAFYSKYEQERKKEKEAAAGSEGKAPAVASAGTTPAKGSESASPGRPIAQAGQVSPVALDLAKSLGYLTKAVEYEPRYDYAQFQLGVVYVHRNQAEQAIASFAKVVAIGGNFAPMARQNLEAVYKLKNKNSLDGIDQVLAKAKAELEVKPAAAPSQP
jgi:tetratricopeptide (TPR) repeat protein